MDHIRLEVPATAENFDEDAYLRANGDVTEAAKAAKVAEWPSGRAHFDEYGFKEGRSLRFDDSSFAGVNVSGNVVVEEDAFIGTGANVIAGTADHPLVIGAGAVVAAAPP